MKLGSPVQKTKRYKGGVNLFRRPFTAVVATLDGSPLPLELSSPGQILRYFEKYNTSSVRKQQSPQYWGITLSRAFIIFYTRDVLQKFIDEVDVISIGGKLLHGWWKLPQGTVPVDALTLRQFHEAQQDISCSGSSPTRRQLQRSSGR